MSAQGRFEVRYHVIADYQTAVTSAGGGDIDEQIAAAARRTPEVRKKRYSVVTLCHHRQRGRIYCGCTNTTGNILHEFNPATGKFKSLGYPKVAEPNEVKIHRGVWLDEAQDALYFGTSTLSDTPALVTAPGGKLVRCDLATRKFTTLGIPVPGCYVQATNYDARRQLMYAFTIPDYGFSVWSLKKKQLVRWHCVSSIVHIAAIDDAGGVWGTGGRLHSFFRYDPDANTFAFPEGCRMASSAQAAGIMYKGAGPVDTMLNGRDGFLYVGSAMGELYRLDPKTHEVHYLGRPVPHNRLPAVAIGEDGLLYGVGGDKDATVLWCYDRAAGTFEVLGKLVAPDGKTCYRPHDLVLIGRTAYVGETDNPKRSGYLWECRF